MELPPLTPHYVLGLTALLLLVIDTVSPDTRKDTLLAGVAALGALVAAATSAWFLSAGTGRSVYEPFGGAMVVDSLALFFTALVSVVAALVVVASYDYVAGRKHRAEYYSLVMLATTGMAALAAANSLATIFVAIELVSLPSYALVAFLKDDAGSVEAGLKYFLVGALSSGVMLYGISLVYGVTGALELPTVAAAIEGTPLVGVLGLGVLMIVGGFAFKTASVPFHFWAPEAYEGAPAPIAAFVSSASKAAAFAAAFRVFTVAFPLDVVPAGVDWALVFAVLAVVTMTLGNFAAATQDTVKRMLAYSSVGQAGYVLIALAALAGDADSLVLGAGIAHLFVYGFMNTGAFLFVALVEHWGVGRTFEDYAGLASEAPVACAAMTVFLFSLAGLPVGGGFFSKYFLFGNAVGAGYTWLVAIAVVNSALSLYYYSRVVKAMWVEDPSGEFGIDSRPVGLYTAVVTAGVGTVALLVAYGPVYSTAVKAATILLG
ncbi:NADH-quinone oxidoreductase subunit N [Halospeciosus flavus]|uniref:NADH-quinone oxidoreductase subunit N n=1 Tax=Halospeciosus flavus TaxID=3032283 RepID=A0ABD5Z439_9EURY|nr:NADH-quinone oxidoreductase subunit N [Halospeciosus flavus]